MTHSTHDKQDRLFVIVHDYVRKCVQAYPAERRNKLALCRELGLVRAATPKDALKQADEGKFCTEQY